MKFGFLFEKREGMIIEQFAATNPTLNDYKEKLNIFSALADSLENQSHVNLGCIRLDYSEYNDKLLERCYFWHSAYGKQLTLECDKIMTSFSERITVNGNIRPQQLLIIIELVISLFYRSDTVLYNLFTILWFFSNYQTAPRQI